MSGRRYPPPGMGGRIDNRYDRSWTPGLVQPVRTKLKRKRTAESGDAALPTKPFTAAARAKTAKAGSKPPPPLPPPEKLVGQAAVAAARALVEGGYSDYDAVRAAVLRSFSGAFAIAYEMIPRNTPIASHVEIGTEPFFAYLRAINSLEYSELTPDHFGHVHEHLSAWKVADGKLVPSSERRGGGVHFTPRSLTEPMVRKTLDPLFRAGVTPERTLELRIADPACGAGAFLLEVVRQLGQRLVDHGIETDILVAKRLVAVHCAYGVDICRWAVASAKIALWLECRATSMPPDWLDGNIKKGDALVGLFNDQITRFHYSRDGEPKGGMFPTIPEVPQIRAAVDRAMELGIAARKLRMSELAKAARAS